MTNTALNELKYSNERSIAQEKFQIALLMGKPIIPIEQCQAPGTAINKT